MMVPTIHLNGTSRTHLLQELETAHGAVNAAIDALRQVTVHGRDYYVQGEFAYGQARTEMDARIEKLEAVKTDLLNMHIAVQEQGR